MMNSGTIKHFIGMLPEEIRLVYQAKSGDANAFAKLYDLYGEYVYRYIHFLVPSNRIAEGLTFQVFFKAWKQLDRYPIFNSSVISWLYSTAQNQVIAYYLTHKKIVTPTLADSVDEFAEEFQTIRNGLQFLTIEQQQVLVLKFIVGLSNKNIARAVSKQTKDVCILHMRGLQALTEHLQETKLTIDIKKLQPILEKCMMSLSNGASTMDECVACYCEDTASLRPLLETALLLDLGRNVKPSSAFNIYIHDALNRQYLRSHPRRRQIVMLMPQRTALTFAMLVAAFLVTGTVHAQSALPGEAFYAWKRTSEQALLAFSPDPVAMDIILVERRLNELIAVSDDPTLSAKAMNSYLEAISRFQSVADVETLTRIMPVLQSQKETLNNAGLPITQLDDYLVAGAGLIPTITPAYIIPSTATNIPPTVTNVPSTATNIPPTVTDVPPTVTDLPPTVTDVPPTATDLPPTVTDVPPTATDLPPTATYTPTEVAPTAVPTFTPEAMPTDEIP